jgi:hypothetical protein
MKNVRKLAFLLFLIATSFVPGFAQNNSDSEKEMFSSPAEEKFQETDALAVPWRSSGCPTDTYVIREPNCHLVTGNEWSSSHMMSLYNEDGSLWYHFSVDPKSSDYFGRNKKKVFLPFATYPDYADVVILRLVGESPHWYKVEVNEETQATKFILKSDPMWAKTRWSYWLAEMKIFKLNEDQPPLRDKPDGQVIEESAKLRVDKVTFLSADGDWAYVKGYSYQKKYQGWIRWRKGRDILIKDRFGILIFPKPSTR